MIVSITKLTTTAQQGSDFLDQSSIKGALFSILYFHYSVYCFNQYSFTSTAFVVVFPHGQTPRGHHMLAYQPLSDPFMLCIILNFHALSHGLMFTVSQWIREEKWIRLIYSLHPVKHEYTGCINVKQSNNNIFLSLPSPSPYINTYTCNIKNIIKAKI